MNLDVIYQLIIGVEMLFVYLTVFDKCFRRKYSKMKTFLLLFTFSIILITLASFKTTQILQGYIVKVMALNIFIGALYFAPLKYLYDQPLRKMLIVQCRAWTFTTLMFAVSLHLAHLFFSPSQTLIGVMLFQTVVYIIFCPYFIKRIKTKFLYVIENFSEKDSTSLLALILLSFLAILLLCYAFILDIEELKILSLLGFIINASFHCNLLYDVVNRGRNVDNLKEMIYTDHLTGVPNRRSLVEEMEKLIQNKTPFHLIFLDLNYFKSINDKYGHLKGDEYLKTFSKRCKYLMQGIPGTLYRISGDEFIFLSLEVNIKLVQQKILKIQQLKGRRFIKDSTFLGVSCGLSSFPKDSDSIETLISIADQRMYNNKRDTRGNSPTYR
ncbi:GGDEF domain-containing protein [Bacillus massiliigorillae]|uniref:GGDEF domain-containing protein n=1 Tax=Bacillus massiliigorillae TaxID=1243664 RepID=UPI00039DD89D|nr:GGDEF domain-containing protein [Bacillus massiliigorillae]